MKKSIAARMNKDILRTFLVIAVLFIVFGILMQLHWRNENIRMVVHLLDTVVTREQNNLANELFEKRTTSLNMRLREMRDIEHIVHIALYDQNRGFLTSASGLIQDREAQVAATLADADLLGMDGAYRVTGGVHSLYFARPITAVGETLGWIAIVYDLSLLRQQILSFFIFYSALLAVMLLGMLLLLRRRLRQSVVIPLQHLGESMRTIRAGQPISLHDFENADQELTDLLGSFQDMAARLGTSYQELGETNKTLRASEKRARNQRAAISGLALDEAIVSGDKDLAFARLVQVAAETTAVSRASVWLLAEDGAILECQALFQAETGHMAPLESLHCSEIPAYMDSLRIEGRVSINDCRADPRIQEMAWYFNMLDISAMLDSGIMINGRLVGIVSLEHVGGQRQWHPDEEAFSSTMAAIAAQIVENARRKQTETMLSQSEQKHRVLFEASPDAIFLLKDERIVDCNPQTLKQFGRPREQLLGRTPDELSPAVQPGGENSLELAAHILHRVEQGQSEIFEWRHVRGDGTEFTAEVSLTKMRLPDDDYVVVFLRDITERKRAEDALLESEEMQRRLLQTVPDLIIRTDMEGTITFVNEQAFPGLESLPDTNICGRTIYSFFTEHDLPRAQENARTRIEKSIGPQQYRLRLGETSIDAEVNGAVIRDLESRPVGMVYVIRDVTERRRAEKEQEKLQSLFLQAQKMESVGTLAGGVAHDFNNLLQVVRGNMELLSQHASLGSQAQSRVQAVINALDRAALLVQQLLLFSRKAESSKIRVDLNHEVREAVKMLERTIPKMIALELRLDPEVWPMDADPVQIEQALLNLAGNAVDAMPEGGKLVIETHNVVLDEDFANHHPGSSAGPHVLLTVTDTGHGMDAQTREYIFDPFFTTKEMGKGTGLGLASAYGIAKSHGGYIQCLSEPGSGTSFKIFWPAMSEQEISPTEEPRESPPQGGDETILVVDDEPEIRELTQEALEGLGYTVKSAVSGEEALELCREFHGDIALVVLDLNMPGMGGYKCLQDLSRMNPPVKVVISSGYSANGSAREVLASGAVGFLGKPYRLKELAAVVRCALDEQRAAPCRDEPK